MFVPRSENFSGINNPTAPINPIVMPIILFALTFDLKTNMPMMSVKKGTSPFSMPVRDEEIPVSAAVKRKAGMKFPHNPIPRNLSQSFFSEIFTYFIENGRTNKNVQK